MLMPEDGQPTSVQHEPGAENRIELQPARDQHPQHVAVPDQGYVTPCQVRHDAFDHRISAAADLGRGLTFVGGPGPHRPTWH